MATFGPAIASYGTTLAVPGAGVDVARVNIRRGDYTVHNGAGPDSPLQHQRVRAIEQAVAKTGLTATDSDVTETFEAIALVGLNRAAAPHIPAKKINANGGAIAPGNPISMSSARLVLHTRFGLGPRGRGRRVAAPSGSRQGDAMVQYGADQTA